MSSKPLFPVLEANDAVPEGTSGSNFDWTSIGKTFVREGEKVHPKKEEEKYYNLSRRPRAVDFLDFGTDEKATEERNKKKKAKEKEDGSARTKNKGKESKKDKKKKKKEKDKRSSRHEYRLRPVTDEILDKMIEEYVPPPKDEWTKRDFVYKHRMDDESLEVSILKFGEEDLYTYGRVMIKDVPRFRRLNRNLILGLKSDASTLSILKELNLINADTRALKSFENKELGCPISERYYSQSPSSEIITVKRNVPRFRTVHVQEIIPFNAEKENDQLITRKTFSVQNGMLVETEVANASGIEGFVLDKSEVSQAENRLMEINKEFLAQLDKNPNDINVWLKFMDEQDKLLSFLPATKKQMIVDKKLNILEKALGNEKLRQNHSTLLMLLHLKWTSIAKVNEDVHKVVSTLWEQYLSQDFLNPTLWSLFFDFKFTWLLKFSESFMRISISEVIQQIKGNVLKYKGTEYPSQLKEIALLLISHVCYVEYYCGYKERANGLLQALVELNVFRPNQFAKWDDEKNLIEIPFQKYWENFSAFRTGETLRSRGWESQVLPNEESKADFETNFIGKYETTLKASKPRVETLFEVIYTLLDNEVVGGNEMIEEAEEKEPLVTEWVRNEIAEEEFHRPANLTFDVEKIKKNNDSVVIFEDISHFLLVLNDTRLNLQLIDYFMDHFDFPRIFSRNLSFIDDIPFLNSQQLHFQQNLKSLIEKLPQEMKTLYNDGISTFDWFLKFPSYNVWLQKPRAYLLDLEYIRRLLTFLLEKYPNNLQILGAIFYIEGFYLVHSHDLPNDAGIKDSKKRIKALLKAHESRIELWFMFIELEFMLDKSFDKATKIFDKVLQATKKEKVLVIYYYINFVLRHQIPNKNQILVHCLRLLVEEKAELSFINLANLSKIETLTMIKKLSKVMEISFATEPKSQKDSASFLSQKTVWISLSLVWTALSSNLQEYQQYTQEILTKEYQELNKLSMKLNGEAWRVELENVFLIEINAIRVARAILDDEFQKKDKFDFLTEILSLNTTQLLNATLLQEFLPMIKSFTYRINKIAKIFTIFPLEKNNFSFLTLLIGQELYDFANPNEDVKISEIINHLRSITSRFSIGVDLFDDPIAKLRKGFMGNNNKVMELKQMANQDKNTSASYSVLRVNSIHPKNVFFTLVGHLLMLELHFSEEERKIKRSEKKLKTLALLRECPFNRDFYLWNIKLASKFGPPEQFNHIAALILEKEIRVVNELDFI